MTGVWPRGAQVLRTTGSSEAPDSSQNTITARRRRALRQIRRPVLGHPAGNRLLVTFDGAAGGALPPPAHAAQQLPGVAGMVAVTGPLLDHGGDAGQGPVVGVEAVGAGALAERLVQVVALLVRKARRRPGGAAAGQRLPSACQRACQRLTFWRATPSWWATWAWCGRRQTAPRLAGGRLRRPGGRADRGRCGDKRLVSSGHAARRGPIMSPEHANLFKVVRPLLRHSPPVLLVIGRSPPSPRRDIRAICQEVGNLACSSCG